MECTTLALVAVDVERTTPFRSPRAPVKTLHRVGNSSPRRSPDATAFLTGHGLHRVVAEDVEESDEPARRSMADRLTPRHAGPILRP